MKLKTLLLAALISGIFACSEDDIQIVSASGTMVDVSTMAGLENCGFMIRIDGELYKPTYLNAQYEQDGLSVLVKVEFLNESSDCSTLALAPSKIRIEQIRLSN